MATNIGMMDSAYFVGRNEILSWINTRLHLNLSRIEEVPFLYLHFLASFSLLFFLVLWIYVTQFEFFNYPVCCNFMFLCWVFQKENFGSFNGNLYYESLLLPWVCLFAFNFPIWCKEVDLQLGNVTMTKLLTCALVHMVLEWHFLFQCIRFLSSWMGRGGRIWIFRLRLAVGTLLWPLAHFLVLNISLALHLTCLRTYLQHSIGNVGLIP